MHIDLNDRSIQMNISTQTGKHNACNAISLVRLPLAIVSIL